MPHFVHQRDAAITTKKKVLVCALLQLFFDIISQWISYPTCYEKFSREKSLNNNSTFFDRKNNFASFTSSATAFFWLSLYELEKHLTCKQRRVTIHHSNPKACKRQCSFASIRKVCACAFALAMLNIHGSNRASRQHSWENEKLYDSWDSPWLRQHRATILLYRSHEGLNLKF